MGWSLIMLHRKNEKKKEKENMPSWPLGDIFWQILLIVWQKKTSEIFREMCFSNVNSTNFAKFLQNFPNFYIKFFLGKI